MDQEKKDKIRESMENCDKGVIGLFALFLEQQMTSVPVSKLECMMAVEIISEANARMVNKPDHEPVVDTREVLDMIREHIRNLDDEEFFSFVSDEAIYSTVAKGLTSLNKKQPDGSGGGSNSGNNEPILN